ncbi:hypothetical protein FB567DRAFT_527461 [Paraphoma chrysanthemicola]|uniref:Zn(2)-C6 fungal-type domain-containing protein n=1 Tax=Paraphoma chrysanthemicola TaxID=798071 RepID=A0A8K0R4M5_9PLEO|nr:hypothetical protein FB567DRAFT_527461 [Paraphoma chrysanthemicola]
MSFPTQTLQWPNRKQLDTPTSSPTTMSTPTIKSPTSAPKSSSAKERRPKLRASCDACAASKVKCSKEHPICARCSGNGSQCIYGVSRKHGKPGRTRKRNPDGTPFIKGSKQRPSPDGSEFGKFRIRPEPNLPSLSDFSDTGSNWSSNWSSTPSLPGTPEFEFEMTPEPFYMDSTDYPFMDDIMLPTTQPEAEPMQSMEAELTFRDPFAKRQSVQLDLPNIQPLKDFIGGDSVNPMDYSFPNTNLDPFFMSTSASASISTSTSCTSPLQSPKNTSHDHQQPQTYNPMRVSISLPTSHCCSTLAYSTLESLRMIGSDASPAYPSMECKSLDNVLSSTRLGVQSIRQLLACPCSADPHLAMLYSSITSKILTWYQIAAGVNTTSSSHPSSSLNSSPTSSGFNSPLSTPSSELSNANFQFQALQFGVYQFDEAQQLRLRRQVVLRELKTCGTLVEALANWSGRGEEQGEFLYDVLGAWLKSELYKTVREIEGKQAAAI